MSKNNPIKILTPRFALKSWVVFDAPEYKRALEETKDFLIPWMPWMPWAHGKPESVKIISERLSIYEKEHLQGKNYRFGIYEQSDNKLIGECGLYNRVEENSIETGYWIHKNYLRLGIASEVANALINVAFEILNKQVVEIHCNADNKPSASIPKKLGFKLHSVIENEVDYQDQLVLQMTWVLTKEMYKEKSLKKIDIQAFNEFGNLIPFKK